MLSHQRIKCLNIVFLLLLNIFEVYSQKFTFQGGEITDYQSDFKIDSFPLSITKLTSVINSDFGLSKICIDVSHDKLSDLKIELQSPDGTKIWLTNRNGGDGKTYSNTCFRANGFSGYIHKAEAPFDGEYTPDGILDNFNNNQNPNGTWYLLIQDLKQNGRGNLNLVSLEFNKDPNPLKSKVPCTFETPENCKCSFSNTNCEMLPDLIILEKFTKTQIKEYPYNHKEFPGMLLFAASIANVGDGPIEIFGTNQWFCGEKKVDDFKTLCSDGTSPRQQVAQRVYKKQNERLVFTDTKAGYNYYDSKPGHDHYHVDNWVEYRLVSNKKKKVISKGRKVSYCLWDTGICNSSDSLCNWKNKVYGEQNLKNYGLGNYQKCNEDKQGISVGGYDTYGYMYEGQFLKLPQNLESGWYSLEIEIDPENLYKEKNKKNNIFKMQVYLDKQSKSKIIN